MSIFNLVMAAAGLSSGPVQGQVLFTNTDTVTWTVPAGVTSISIVCVQEGGINGSSSPGYSYVRNSGLSIVCMAQNGARVGDGGGDGGFGGTGSGTQGSGGGGAGGYAGNGGNGSSGGGAATAGVGGAAGGGYSGTAGSFSIGWTGGGVGVLGQGSSGAAGTLSVPGGGAGSGGQDGTQDVGVLYGAGYRGAYFSGTHTAGGRGGALSYKNNITVTPGDVFYISPYGPTAESNGNSNAAIRIIWGEGRAFPSTNTGNV